MIIVSVVGHLPSRSRVASVEIKYFMARTADAIPDGTKGGEVARILRTALTTTFGDEFSIQFLDEDGDLVDVDLANRAILSLVESPRVVH